MSMTLSRSPSRRKSEDVARDRGGHTGAVPLDGYLALEDWAPRHQRAWSRSTSVRVPMPLRASASAAQEPTPPTPTTTTCARRTAAARGQVHETDRSRRGAGRRVSAPNIRCSGCCLSPRLFNGRLAVIGPASFAPARLRSWTRKSPAEVPPAFAGDALDAGRIAAAVNAPNDDAARGVHKPKDRFAQGLAVFIGKHATSCRRVID